MANEMCSRCGYTLAPEDEACPKCRLPIRREDLTPLGGAPSTGPTGPRVRDVHREREELHRVQPTTRAEGEDWPGSWGYVKFIAKQDPLITVVMALLAVNAALSIGRGDLVSMLLAGAMFWGVFTFQTYGFWMAIVISGLQLLMAIMLFSLVPLLALVYAAISAFTIVVLVMRREYFS